MYLENDDIKKFIDWKVNRIRVDREKDIENNTYFGNDFRVAKINWLNYVDKFPFELLWEGPFISAGYFDTNKSNLHFAQTAYTSYMKSLAIKNLAYFNWAIDAAIEKVQDLKRYIRNDIKNLIGIDMDRQALVELIRRRYTFLKPNQKHIHNDEKQLSLPLVNADLSNNYKEVSELVKSVYDFPEEGVNDFVCNLAIHYFCDTMSNLRNFALLVNETTGKDGTVIISNLNFHYSR